MRKTGLLLATWLSFCLPTIAETTVKIDIAKSVEQISPYIYGQFIEHLGHCIHNGIWAELLEDRKFFYAVGDKESPWKSIYDCRMRMVKDGAFVGEHSAESYTTDEDQPRWLGVRQLEFPVRKGKTYPGYAWVKASKGIEKVEVHFHWDQNQHTLHHKFEMPVKAGEYYKIEFEFKPTVDSDNVEIEVAAFGKGTFTVGCVSLMPGDNVDGMRADTLELLKRLDSPIYRWPGGNFVSGYDWKDGIGERDKRPPRKNPAWKGIEPNDFGLDEFMRFCNILKTEPYIAVNTGNGDVASAVEELEYANGSPETPMGALRKKNGNAEPYNVIWWGIGNEMYGNWQIGHMPVEKYVEKNNAFVDAFRKKDPKVKVIAVGHVGKWDEAFLPGAADHMDLISEHFYSGEKKDSITDYVRQIPNQIKRIADAHRKYRKELPKFKDRNPPVPIALDEWNYWSGKHIFGEAGVRYFMRDGLGVAAGIHEFARQADMYFMANYAQTVNVLGAIKTTKTGAQMETTGLALELYRRQFGNVAVKTECGNPALDAQAALHQTGLTIGIVNTSDKPETIKLDVVGYDISGKTVRQFVIADPENNPMGFNDPDQPVRIAIAESELKSFDGSVVVKPLSVTLLRLTEHGPEPSLSMLRQVARLKAKGLPLTDYHIHLRGGMTPEKAFLWAKKTGVRSGVLENHGKGWPISDNDKLKAFIEDARKFPELLVGIQVNDRDWFKTIDSALRAKFDFVLADTMIMDGQKLWQENEYDTSNEDAWLERYFAHCMTVVNEPITILANPTYLPNKIAHRYNDFWTEERMDKLIDAAVKNNVALEIQAGTKFPNKKFVELAMKKGAKISIGRNNHDDKPNELNRSLDWLEELDVKRGNMLGD